MSQFITQMGDDLACVNVKKLAPEDREYLFIALADFFKKNVKHFMGEDSGEKVHIEVNIHTHTR